MFLFGKSNEQWWEIRKYQKHKIQKSKLEQISQGKLPNSLLSILALGEVISPKIMKSSSVLESIKTTISEKNIGAIFGKEGNKNNKGE